MSNKPTISEIHSAALAKGWNPHSVVLIEKAGFADFYILAAERLQPVMKDRPFMTITVRAEDQDGIHKVSFHSGHYDLDLQGMADELFRAVATLANRGA